VGLFAAPSPGILYVPDLSFSVEAPVRGIRANPVLSVRGPVHRAGGTAGGGLWFAWCFLSRQLEPRSNQKAPGHRNPGAFWIVSHTDGNRRCHSYCFVVTLLAWWTGKAEFGDPRKITWTVALAGSLIGS
jgi:hypothetical protein